MMNLALPDYSDTLALGQTDRPVDTCFSLSSAKGKAFPPALNPACSSLQRLCLTKPKAHPSWVGVASKAGRA